MVDKKDNPEKVAEDTAAAVQKQVDEEHEKGYLGEAVDDTPRENYSVAGVLAGKPTPESTELETPGR